MGLPEWLVARSIDEYIEKAAILASDAPRREELKKYLLDSFQPSKVKSLDIYRGDPDLVCRWFMALIEHRHELNTAGAKLLKVPAQAA